MPYPAGPYGPGVPMGMPMPGHMPMHPAMAGQDLMGMNMMGYPGYPGLGPMHMPMPSYHPTMLGGMRSRRSPYHDMYGYGYGSGRGGSRYLDPYDLFDDVFDDDVYVDDYDDIDDPLMLYMRMARGGRGRRGRRSRYGRYGGSGLGYHGYLL